MKNNKSVTFIKSIKQVNNSVMDYLVKRGYTVDIKDTNDNICNTENIVCDAPLTYVAKLLENGTNIKNLIIIGGFIGCNVLSKTALPERFKDIQYTKDLNLSADVESSTKVFLSSDEHIGTIYMISKNAEDSITNDKLAEEIINILENKTTSFRYMIANPIYNTEDDTWGCDLYLMPKEGRSRRVKIAIGVTQ